MLYDLPPVTRALLIANVVVFLLEQIPSLQPLMIAYGALWPVGPAHPMLNGAGGVVLVGFHFWQVITYAFLHGNWMHILFNMFALWMFGGPIEHLLGAKHDTVYYFFCAVTAAIAHMLVAHYFLHGFTPTPGSSGAIFGLLVRSGVTCPPLKMYLISLPIPMPAWLFVSGYIMP